MNIFSTCHKIPMVRVPSHSSTATAASQQRSAKGKRKDEDDLNGEERMKMVKSVECQINEKDEDDKRGMNITAETRGDRRER